MSSPNKRKIEVLMNAYKRQKTMNKVPTVSLEDEVYQQKLARRFVEDLLTYQMWAHDIFWEPLWAEDNKDVPRYCTSAVANISFQVTKRLSHYYYIDEHYTELFCEVTNPVETFERYVEIMGNSWFHDGFTWSKFSTFLTFLTNLAVHCSKMGQELCVDGIVLSVGDYIHSHLSGHIRMKGGWKAYELHCTRISLAQEYNLKFKK